MGQREINQIPKDEPDSNTICRFHSVTEVSTSTFFLSVNQQSERMGRVIWMGDEAHPHEIQITNGAWQTAIVLPSPAPL